ncbi:MAG: FG-GAP repeat protein, partial [Planctomycetales bacterium]|nr:FG-GAP repeat protein [Planctomycetales bacterium]
LVYEQTYAYYEARNIEGTRIETRAGNDVVHADAEYRFSYADGSGRLTEEWGIKRGNYQEGASIGALTIDGGDGNDQLFGGVLDDTILGGPGADYISGGDGNDQLDGGGDNDLIVGASSLVAPDRYEAFTGNVTSQIGQEIGFNNNPLFASTLPALNFNAATTIGDLTLSFGDPGDWYLLPAPYALNQWGVAERAVLATSDLQVRFVDSDAAPDATAQTLFDNPSYWSGRNYSLFAAQLTDDQGTPRYLPVENYSGVPDYYLLHVNNVNSYGIRALDNRVVPTANATVAFGLSIDGGQGVDVSVAVTAHATANTLVSLLNASLITAGLSGDVFAYLDSEQRIVISLRRPGTLQMGPLSTTGTVSNLSLLGMRSGQDNLRPAQAMGGYQLLFDSSIASTIDVPANAADTQISSTFAADQARVIPLGNMDIDDDGIADFIATVQDGGVRLGDQSIARIALSSHSIQSSTTAGLTLPIDTTSVQLVLPLPLDSTSSERSEITVGDIDGDGFDDLIVGVISSSHRDSGVYVVYGGPPASGFDVTGGKLYGSPSVVDVVNDADVLLTTTGGIRSIAAVGNAVGNVTSAEDLLIATADGAILIAGAARSSTTFAGSGGIVSLDLDDAVATGTGTYQAGGIDFTTSGLWHLSSGRSNSANSSSHSSPKSFYFGQGENASGGGNYNTGQRTQGSLTMEALTLEHSVDSLQLRFKSFFKKEPSDAYDVARVLVSIGGAVPIVAAASNNPAGPTKLQPSTGDTWQELVLNFDLAPYAGTLAKGTTVQVTFEFDSRDASYNNFEGWYVDDIQLRAPRTIESLTSPAVTTFNGTFAAPAQVAYVGEGASRDSFAVVAPTAVFSNGLIFYSVYIVHGADTFLSSVDLTSPSNTVRVIPIATRLTNNPLNFQVTPKKSDGGNYALRSVFNYFPYGSAWGWESSALNGQTFEVTRYYGRMLTPLGDIDRDGLLDVAQTTIRPIEELDEVDSGMATTVFDIYLGVVETNTAADLTTRFATPPDMQLVTSRTVAATDQDLRLTPGGIIALGNIHAVLDNQPNTSRIAYDDLVIV